MTGRRALSLLAGALAFAILAAPAAERSPRDLIAAACDRLLGTLVVSGDAVRADPRLAWQLASETVLPFVDFERVGRRVLGKHWRTASPAQRSAYQQAFRAYASHFLVTAMVTYSEAMASYADRVSFPPIRWRPGDDQATVRMLVRLAGGLSAEVTYRMHLVAGEWRVWDVTLEGLSLVLMYRDSFAQEITRYGLDGFIERLVAYAGPRRG